VPLKPTQLDQFRKTIAKYTESKAFSSADATEWECWFSEQESRQSEECGECFELTSRMRKYGTRKWDSQEEDLKQRAVVMSFIWGFTGSSHSRTLATSSTAITFGGPAFLGGRCK
jgi:hypothetical protein